MAWVYRIQNSATGRKFREESFCKIAHVTPESFGPLDESDGKYMCKWFIGITFNKVENQNIDLTYDIQSFTMAVHRQAMHIKLFKPDMKVEIKHLKRKQLDQYVPKDVLERGKQAEQKKKMENRASIGNVPKTEPASQGLSHSKSDTELLRPGKISMENLEDGNSQDSQSAGTTQEGQTPSKDMTNINGELNPGSPGNTDTVMQSPMCKSDSIPTGEDTPIKKQRSEDDSQNILGSPMHIDSSGQSPSRKREGSPVQSDSPVKRSKSIEEAQSNQSASPMHVDGLKEDEEINRIVEISGGQQSHVKRLPSADVPDLMSPQANPVPSLNVPRNNIRLKLK